MLRAVANRAKGVSGVELAAALVMGILSIAFVVGALGHAQQHNRKSEASDQGAYLDFAIKLRETGRVQMDGARGPLYPLVLSLLSEPEEPRPRYFAGAKTLNVWLSAAAWLAVWPLVRRCSSLGPALAAWATIGMTAIVYYAPWVKAEALFFLAQLAAFLLFARLLVRPTLGVAMGAGFALALAYLLKSSASILLIAFVLAALLDAALGFFTTRGAAPASPSSGLARRALMAAAAAAVFVVLCSPFFLENKRKFGQYTYNVNSNFYMWYDNWAAAKRGTRAHGDRVGWPQMPESKLPSARKYFATHSASQIGQRVASGLRRSFLDMHRRHMIRYLGTFLLLAMAVVVTRFHAVRERARGRAGLLLFTGAFFFAHVLLSAWFYPLSTGARIMAAGYPIAIVALAVVIDTKEATWNVKGRRTSAGAVLTALTALMLVVDVPLWLADDFQAGRGGR